MLAALDRPGEAYWRGDGLVFWAGARAVLEGVDPYDPAWWERLAEREGRPPTLLPYRADDGPVVTTSYPLWTFLVCAPFGMLPFGLAAAAWLVAQLVVMTIALAALSRALFERPGRDGLLLCGLAAGFQPTWILVANGNMTGFLFGALAAAFLCLRSERPYLAGSWLGLLASKPHPFLIVPFAFLATTGRPMRLVAGAVTTVAVLLVASLAVRPGWIPAWLAQVSAAGSVSISSASATGLDRVLGMPFAPVVAILVALTGFVVWWYARRPEGEVLAAGAIAVSLFVAPYGWSYDELHLLVVAAVIIRLLPREGRGRLAGLAILAGLAGPLPWVLYAVSFARMGEELTAIVPVLFFVLLVVVHGRATRGGPGRGPYRR